MKRIKAITIKLSLFFGFTTPIVVRAHHSGAPDQQQVSPQDVIDVTSIGPPSGEQQIFFVVLIVIVAGTIWWFTKKNKSKKH